MSFLEILDTLLLKSLELIFGVVYMLIYRLINHPGLSIVALSMFMNFLVLPLYMRADAIQEEEYAAQKKLQRGIDHIKRTFKGDECMMMLQTFYRQNHYKPIYALRSALSLLLQIPFFIAAYRFLANLQLLNGASLGPIADLGSPDGMLAIGEASINLLPFVMTAVNLASCVIFTKSSPWKAKIQLYGMALFFLVFLYHSPAGLVFYWTFNNVFSLAKTCFIKLKNAKKIVIKNKTIRKCVQKTENKGLFLAGGLFLAVLAGALIPSSVIAASPLEFMDITYFYHPLWFVVSSFCLAVGVFVVWTGVFYFLAKPAVRVYFDSGVWIVSGVFIADYMFFGKDAGLLTKTLTYESKLEFTGASQAKNVLVVIVAMIVFYAVYRYRNRLAAEILAVGVLALCSMTAVNMAGIHSAVASLKERNLENYEAVPRFTLSKTGKNVIVLMIDQAVSKYVPYLFEEKPGLKEQFEGFTYYANTVSFGAHTNFCTPSLFGGYEYTPAEINKRAGESLASKQNEALKVMPVLFDQNGFRVTVCDPPYAGYQWIPDLSIYDEYPEIQKYILSGKFTEESVKHLWIQDDKRNFFCYGILKSMPLCFQKIIYDYGRYNQEENVEAAIHTNQTNYSLYTAYGMSAGFIDCYNELAAYPNVTDAVDDNTNTFLMMVNGITHEAMMLQEPDYVPSIEVDNTEYEKKHQSRYTVNGQTLPMKAVVHFNLYQTSMAAMLQLGEWFDYMREKDVYDNTRIILVADHGRSYLLEGDEYRLGERDIDNFHPLLMVKDFNGKEFVTSEEFMTNGDVPTLAMKDIIDSPVNPFTGKRIDSSEKTRHDQYIPASEEFNIEENCGNAFFPSKWFAVHDDMRDVDNWRLLSEEETVLPPVENAEAK